MNHITDYYPKSIIMCEYCHKDIEDLADMVQVTITRNPLEDNNIIKKHHIYCQACWNRVKILIDQLNRSTKEDIKKIDNTDSSDNPHICTICDHFICDDVVHIIGHCNKFGITRSAGDICIHEEDPDHD